MRLGAALLSLAVGAALIAATGEAPPPEPAAEATGEPTPQAPPPAPFHDVTEAAGITFVHSNGAKGEKLLPETMGGGVAFFDYDGDGDSDLLFVDSAGEDTGGSGAVLYRNDARGHFEDVTEKSGLASAVPVDPGDPYGTFYGMGVAAADYDGDGWIDVYLTAVGRNHLLRNTAGTFQDVTAEAGVGGGSAWSTGATFFDVEGDGDLDLFVCNYLDWSPAIDRTPESIAQRTVATVDGGKVLTYGRPQSYLGQHPFLFVNQGDGTFKETSEPAGLHVTNRTTGDPVAKALAVAPIDIDRDGRLDLFIANDTTRNLFFHNLGPDERGTPHFEEVGELYGLAYDPNGNTTGAMGVDWGYLDDTDNLSILVGNYAEEPTSLYRAQGDPTFFADEAQQAGIAAATRKPLTFGLLLLDYDLDGRLDLLKANGHVEPDIAEIDPTQSYRQPPQLFWNAGEAAKEGGRPSSRRFVEVPPGAAGDLGAALAGRGATYADVDGDADLDVVMTQIGGRARLLRNDQATAQPWLRLRLEDRKTSLHAPGATVEVTAGGETWRREILTTRSYLSQVEPEILFGPCGDGPDEGAERVAVTWPDGSRASGQKRQKVPTVFRTSGQKGQKVPTVFRTSGCGTAAPGAGRPPPLTPAGPRTGS
jgi:hypothetical protein